MDCAMLCVLQKVESHVHGKRHKKRNDGQTDIPPGFYCRSITLIADLTTECD